MSSSGSLNDRIKLAFKLVESKKVKSYPKPSELSVALVKLFGAVPSSTEVRVEPAIAAMFTTAAVEMWMRAVHSYLISAALTETSPIWASVVGYYSSHYSIRAYAHLLGYFQVFKIKKVACLINCEGQWLCRFDKKDGGGREHVFYWRVVKEDGAFQSDPLFACNTRGADESDCGHREKANYHDHLYNFPQVQTLSTENLKSRLDRLSTIEFHSPQIPRVNYFPDLDNVQLIAYHRLVHFRKSLGEALADRNRFWNAHQSPPWAAKWIDFQLPQQNTILNKLGDSL